VADPREPDGSPTCYRSSHHAFKLVMLSILPDTYGL
jgi:hypothetical protein